MIAIVLLAVLFTLTEIARGQPGEALRLILEAQDKRLVAPLVEALAHTDERVRARAAFALASVQDSLARPALERALKTDSAPVRREAAFALGQLFSPRLAPVLEERLREEADPEVRARLWEALGKCADSTALRRLAGWQELSPSEEIGRLWAIARAALRGVTHPATDRIILRALADPRPEARYVVAYYCSRAPLSSWADQVELLARAATQPDFGSPEALAHVLRALGRLGRAEDREPIRTAGNHPDWRVRVEAVRALARLRPMPWDELTPHLEDPHVQVRWTCAEVVGTAPERAPEALRARLRQRIRIANLDPRERGLLLVALAAHEPETAAQLLDTLDLAPPFARIRLVEALGRLPGPEARNRLLELWSRYLSPDSPAVVRNAIFEALRRKRANGQLADQEALHLYRQALASRDLALMTLAAQAASTDTLPGRLLAPELIQTLQTLRSPAEVEAREALIATIVRLRLPEAVPLLESLLVDSTAVVARAAAQGIRTLTGRPLPDPTPPPPAPVYRAEDVIALRGQRPKVRIYTPYGSMLLELYPEEAPFTVWNFLTLARSGRLDGVPFHRVVANFVVKGGDFARGDGWGGPEYAIRSEFTHLRFERGTLGMASAGKDTEGSQYFICHSAQPHLDGRYTAFGRLLEGWEVLDRLLPGDPALQVQVLEE